MNLEFGRSFLPRVMALSVLVPGLGWPLSSFAKVDLQVRASQTARYFLVDERLRHQVTEVGLRQVADVREGVTTVVDGRMRYDAALFPTPVLKMRDYSKDVRDDEGFEAGARQAYVDLLTSSWAMKIGLIQFDWMESLSPRTSDAVTALDLRYGGFDSAGQIMEPVGAFSANTSVGFGSFEFMVVPRGKHHRLPKGENGYGYGERVNRLLAGLERVVKGSGLRGSLDTGLKHGGIPVDIPNAEFGARFLKSARGIDFSAFAWRGHQRTPALELSLFESEDSTTLAPAWELMAQETYQQMNSYGVFASYGGEAAVFRLFSLYEPGRKPGVLLDDDLAALVSMGTPDPSVIVGDRAYRKGAVDDRLRAGGGFDYVFSRHLKIYSEGYVTVSRVTGVTVPGEGVEETYRDHTLTLRVTNESFSDVFISCDSTITGPDRSWLVNPDLSIDWRTGDAQRNGNSSEASWKLSVGGWLVQSESDKSALRILRDARQVYLRLATWM